MKKIAYRKITADDCPRGYRPATDEEISSWPLPEGMILKPDGASWGEDVKMREFVLGHVAYAMPQSA